MPAKDRLVKVLSLCLKSLSAIASSGEAGGEERIAIRIVDAIPNAFGIHGTLGPGLLEKVQIGIKRIIL